MATNEIDITPGFISNKAKSNKKKLTKRMRGYVGTMFEDYGFIQQTTTLPSAVKANQVCFRTSSVKGPTVKSGDFVSFLLNFRFPDKPFAVWVKKIPKGSDTEVTRNKKKLTKEMQGYVVKMFEDYGFIQPTTTLPSTVKGNQVHFRTSSVEGPAVKSGDFVSFLLNFRFLDRPFAVWVKNIPKGSPQSFTGKDVKCPDAPDAASVKEIPSDRDATSNEKKLTKKMQGYVVKMFEDYGFIQPTTTLPSTVKANQVRFRTSSVEGPAVKSGDFVSFLLNSRFPDRPFAVKVKNIPPGSPQSFTREAASGKEIPSDAEAASNEKKLTKKMQGYVGKMVEDKRIIQPTTTLPSAVKANKVYFKTSSVEGPAVKSGDFVSFLLNLRFPDRPFAVWVKKIPKGSPQSFTGKDVEAPDAASVKKIPSDSGPGSFKKKDSKVSELDDLLCATVISVNGRSGFMRHTHDLPRPFNHANKVVQFETPGDLMGKPPKKGQKAVFTLDKESQKKLVAKDVVFLHTSYNPKTTIPYASDLCDHICFRNKGDTESEIPCQKDCARILMCGHACLNKCAEKCSDKCKECESKSHTSKEQEVSLEKCKEKAFAVKRAKGKNRDG